MLTREQFQPIYEQGADAVYEVIATLQATLAAQQEQIATLSMSRMIKNIIHHICATVDMF